VWKLSKGAVWFATVQPGLTKGILWLWAQSYIRSSRSRPAAEHWLLKHLAEQLNYRIPVTTRLGNGMKIKVAWNDHVGRHIFERGYYEEPTVNVIAALLRPGMVFFDVGAHVGQYTLVASGLVGEQGQVHSFEPDPDTFGWLAENVAQNGLRNVFINPLAVSDDTSARELFLATAQDVGSNSLSQPLNYSGKKFTVRCTTLNEYIKAKRIGRIDVMKMDIEGAEYAALTGASDVLQSNEKPTLVIEFEERRQRAFGSSCLKLAELLKNHGYAVFTLGRFDKEYVPKPDDPPTFNVLAIPENKKAAVLKSLADDGRVCA